MAEPEPKLEPKQEAQDDTTQIKVDKTKGSSPPAKPPKKDKKSKKEKRSKKHRSKSRSDSESTDESKSKSRDRNDKKRAKKHKKHRRRSESSESKSRSQSNSRRRRRSPRGNRRDYDRRRERDDRDRRRDRDRERNQGNDRDKKKEATRDKDGDDRRSRTRSPHPLLKRQGGAAAEIPIKTKIDDVNKSKMFWDGFQWVPKVNNMANADPNLVNQNKKMKRLVISNLPLHLGLKDSDIGEFVTKFIVENYLNDEGNFQPVKEVTVEASRNSATIELSSVEEASRLAKVESIKILGNNCRVSKVGENKFGTTTNLATKVADAQTAGQAQAAALAAMNMIQRSDVATSFTLSKLNLLSTASKVLKITNLMDAEAAKEGKDNVFNELLEDIAGEFSKFGKITEQFIVKPGKVASGAEAGTIFLTYENESSAEKAMNAMANKRYEGKEIIIIYVDEEVYKKNFAKLKAT